MLSAPETASLEVDEAGVISEKEDETAEEGSEEEPSTFKNTMIYEGESKGGRHGMDDGLVRHHNLNRPLNETRQVISNTEIDICR